jgi:hypothetical protein
MGGGRGGGAKQSLLEHAIARQEANDNTMFSGFIDARFACTGVTSAFFRRDGRFFSLAHGPDSTSIGGQSRLGLASERLLALVPVITDEFGD